MTRSAMVSASGSSGDRPTPPRRYISFVTYSELLISRCSTTGLRTGRYTHKAFVRQRFERVPTSLEPNHLLLDQSRSFEAVQRGSTSEGNETESMKQRRTGQSSGHSLVDSIEEERTSPAETGRRGPRAALGCILLEAFEGHPRSRSLCLR